MAKKERRSQNVEYNMANRQLWGNSTAFQNFSHNSLLLMRNKLFNIQLPTFEGDEQKFLNYKSQFQRFVHNNKEVESEDKLVYL